MNRIETRQTAANKKPAYVALGKKKARECGLDEIWCWYLCIPPAPVQTAHSFEASLTRKNVNEPMLARCQTWGR